jgi:hypothetical protein
MKIMYLNDDHQKVSPRKGYSINDKAGQHPEQIVVCTQQERESNGKIYTRDGDCRTTIQNNDKTYWYTILQYPKSGNEGE